MNIFGPVNALAVFQGAINSILGNLRFTIALVYLNDLLIPSVDFNTGLESLKLVPETFRKTDVIFRLCKCNFFKSSIEYLGHEMESNQEWQK